MYRAQRDRDHAAGRPHGRQGVAEATARFREAAIEFARDSESELGGIRRTTQGVFEILPRDPAPGISQETRIEKSVRVVATVEYFLRG